MQKIVKAFKQYREAILYIVFGGLTTAVNIITYSLLFYFVGISNNLSNIYAWIFSVAFAYVTNKLFVFENKSFAMPKLLVEIGAFFLCRLLTGLLDIGLMYLFVDVLLFHALLMKTLSNVIVIVLNYVASKALIFKKKHDAE